MTYKYQDCFLFYFFSNIKISLNRQIINNVTLWEEQIISEYMTIQINYHNNFNISWMLLFCFWWCSYYFMMGSIISTLTFSEWNNLFYHRNCLGNGYDLKQTSNWGSGLRFSNILCLITNRTRKKNMKISKFSEYCPSKKTMQVCFTKTSKTCSWMHIPNVIKSLLCNFYSHNTYYFF